MTPPPRSPGSTTRRAARLVAFTALAASLAPLLPSAEIRPWARIGVAMAIVVGLARPLRPLPRGWRAALNVALLAALAPIWALHRDTADPLLVSAHIVLVIDAFAVMMLRDPAELGRLYLLGGLTLTAASAFETGLLWGAGALVYAVCLAAGVIVLADPGRRASPEGSYATRAEAPRTVGVAFTLLLAATAAFALAPRTGMGAFNRLGARVRQLAGFSDTVSLDDYGRVHQNPEVVMRVRFPAGTRGLAPDTMRWRGVAFDHFDGARWSHAGRRSLLPGRTLDHDKVLFADAGAADFAAWVEHEIQLQPTGTRYLFGLDWVTAIALPRKRTWWHTVQIDADWNVLYRTQPAPGFTYTAWSDLTQPPGESLGLTGTSYPDRIRALYLQVPRLDPRIGDLAARVTHDAASPLDKVAAVMRYVRSEHRYTTDIPARAVDAGAIDAPLTDFLFRTRRGHCEYFSTAAAVLLRVAGVPVRSVNGFVGADYNPVGDYYAVTQGHAHSWIEVYFDSGDWVAFDPTPPTPADVSIHGGLGLTLRRYLDAATWAMTRWWYDAVVAFDDETRDALLSRLRDMGATGVWAVGLAVAGFAAIATRRGLFRFRRAPGGPRPRAPVRHPRRGAHARAASRLYGRLLRRLARRGWKKPRSMPPLQFVDHLRHRGCPDAGRIADATNAYLAVRFGGAPLTRATRRLIRA